MEVTLKGTTNPDETYTFLVSGSPVQADVGKAVAIDPATNNTVRLAADGDPIFGQLVALEARTQEGVTLGTVATRGGLTFTLAAAGTATRGAPVQGAGAGLVKGLAPSDLDHPSGVAVHASHDNTNYVVAISGTDVTVFLR